VGLTDQRKYKNNIYRLARQARWGINQHMRPDARQEALKAKLLSLGYPRPKNLKGKSTWWLKSEIGALTPKAKAMPADPNGLPASEQNHLEIAADQAIAHCGGDIRNAIKALIATNEYLRRSRYL
jgi:hypothetical protein